jgi:retron-type reverse transcriptase
MKRHKHLFEQAASLANLLGAAKQALLGKRSRQPGASFFMDLEKELVLLHEELQCGSYRPGAYHYFTIREPKERLVAAAPFRDRVVHHAVVRVIQPLFERRFIEDSFASRPGKGTHAAMRRAAIFAKQYHYALKCDVHICRLSFVSSHLSFRLLLDVVIEALSLRHRYWFSSTNDRVRLWSASAAAARPKRPGELVRS